jgi:hypothetical protein
MNKIGKFASQHEMADIAKNKEQTVDRIITAEQLFFEKNNKKRSNNQKLQQFAHFQRNMKRHGFTICFISRSSRTFNLN